MIKRKILIVEDEIITSMCLKLLLELWGYETCEQVSSGKKAIEKAERESPDLVLIDISIKGEINGIEAARQIRSCFSIPSIFISGYSDKEMIEKAGIAEPVGYLIKPLDFDELKLTIDSFIQKSKEKFKKNK